jgi:hypothetical protein
MSGDSFKPEEVGEHIEVVNPDKGNTEIDAQTSSGDAMDAAESDALRALENTSEEDEATEEEAGPEVAAKSDHQAEDDQAEPDPEIEEEAESSRPTWDGNPDNLPEELKDTYKIMLRGFHQKTRDVAEERKKLQELTAELEIIRAGGRGETEPKGPPQMPMGENTTWEDLARWQQEIAAYYSTTTKEEVLKELTESGKFAPAQELEQMKAVNEIRGLEAEIKAIPGFTDAHAEKMADILNTDEDWGTFYRLNPRGAAHKLAHSVMATMAAGQARTAAAKMADDKVKKKATAASRATSRASTPAAASPEDVFATQGFKTQNEKMEYAERLALEGLGGG